MKEEESYEIIWIDINESNESKKLKLSKLTKIKFIVFNDVKECKDYIS